MRRLYSDLPLEHPLSVIFLGLLEEKPKLVKLAALAKGSGIGYDDLYVHLEKMRTWNDRNEIPSAVFEDNCLDLLDILCASRRVTELNLYPGPVFARVVVLVEELRAFARLRTRRESQWERLFGYMNGEFSFYGETRTETLTYYAEFRRQQRRDGLLRRFPGAGRSFDRALQQLAREEHLFDDNEEAEPPPSLSVWKEGPPVVAKATTGDSRWLVLEAERSKARPLSNYGDNAPYSSLDLACRLAFGREFFEVHEGKHSVRTMLAGLMQRFKLVDKQSEIGDLARAIAFLEAYWEETRSEALQAWEQIRSSQARMNQETERGK